MHNILFNLASTSQNWKVISDLLILYFFYFCPLFTIRFLCTMCFILGKLYSLSIFSIIRPEYLDRPIHDLQRSTLFIYLLAYSFVCIYLLYCLLTCRGEMNAAWTLFIIAFLPLWIHLAKSIMEFSYFSVQFILILACICQLKTNDY